MEILVTARERIWGSDVTANTRGGFLRTSAPLWARGQDAFLVIRGTPDQSRPTAMFVRKADEYPLQVCITKLNKKRFKKNIQFKNTLLS